MLKYGDLGYMEQDRGPMLYSITFAFLAAAIFIVILRWGPFVAIADAILT
jgi:hypothetical protein